MKNLSKEEMTSLSEKLCAIVESVQIEDAAMITRLAIDQTKTCAAAAHLLLVAASAACSMSGVDIIEALGLIAMTYQNKGEHVAVELTTTWAPKTSAEAKA